MKLGKKDARHDPRDLKFAAYEVGTIRVPVYYKRNLSMFTDWGMLGNDSVGDCVLAAADHGSMMWSKTGGKTATFTTNNAIRDYSAITGYDPADPNTDQGTNMNDALNYRRRTGVIDAHGHRHKITAYTALSAGSVLEAKKAMHLFELAEIGFKFPASAMDQFDNGEPWTIVPGSPIEGGHDVICVGYGPKSVYVVTWGRVQEMAWTFFAKYVDEAYAILSTEYLVGGLSPQGYNLTQLQLDLSQI